MFLIDLPRLDKGEEIQKGKMTFFGRELIHFLEAMGLDDEIVDSIHKFDFSETKGLAFVHSMFVLAFSISSSRLFEVQSLTQEQRRPSCR